jgi:hypothetical protein
MAQDRRPGRGGGVSLAGEHGGCRGRRPWPSGGKGVRHGAAGGGGRWRDRRERTARVQLGSRRNGAGYDSSGSQLTDRRWIYEYDARAEAAAIA